MSLSTPVFIVASILLMAISAFKPHAFDYTRAKTVDIFAPILFWVSMPLQQISIFSQDVNSIAQLQADNSRLTEENAKLREWYQVALLLDSENKSLRELLNLEVDPKYKSISARVIADTGNTYVKSVLVSAGYKLGVKKGSAVISGEGLIGRVVEVSESTARILLVTDINLRVPVVVEDTGHHAILSGANSENPHLIHIPQGTEIAEGSRLITSGYGGIYPYGLPVGSVVIGKYGVKEVNLYSNFDKLQIVRVVQRIDATGENK